MPDADDGVMRPRVSSIDHIVLTVSDLDLTIAFYRDVIGMEPVSFAPAAGGVRHALRFGNQKINLHAAQAPFRPHAAAPVPGSADLCFLSETPLDAWQGHLAAAGVDVERGPVPRTGATGPILSLYLRDPDGNLIEISTPDRD